jgi:hypothetical protein
MVGIDSQNASLTLETDRATPGVAFAPLGNATRAVLHLTGGYTSFRDSESIKHAWTATGQAPPQTKSGTVGDEEFGFLQTQSAEVMQYFYAGEKRSHGSLTIDVGQSLNPKTCLDSEDDVAPFTSNVRSFDNGTWRAMTGDHPASRCILKLGNVATNKPNFLFHAIDRRSFVTVLTFRLGTQFIPLRWFKWSVSHQFQDQLRRGEVRAARLGRRPQNHRKARQALRQRRHPLRDAGRSRR